MSVTIQLNKPIEVAGETLAELSFTDVTMKEIRECGFPFAVDINNGSLITFDPNVIAKYVSKICKVPPSTVDKLSPMDFIQCQGVIMSFFGE